MVVREGEAGGRRSRGGRLVVALFCLLVVALSLSVVPLALPVCCVMHELVD